jgi:hypothetical protein
MLRKDDQSNGIKNKSFMFPVVSEDNIFGEYNSYLYCLLIMKSSKIQRII